MLRASHRVLRKGGALCFAVIVIADGLTGEELATAIDAGPPEVEAERGYGEMLSTAGFSDIMVEDVTAEYLETAEAWVREWDAESAELRELVGPVEFDERQTRRRHSIEVIRRRLLRRVLISAIKP